jgi:DNA mismatch repair protein MSH6
MAGVPASVVSRAQEVSAEFFKTFKDKLDARRRSSLPVQAHADFVYLINVALGKVANGNDEPEAVGGSGNGKVGVKASLVQQLDVIRECIGKYEV